MMNGMMAGMGMWALIVLVTLLAILLLVVLGSIWLFRRLRQDDPDRRAGRVRTRRGSCCAVDTPPGDRRRGVRASSSSIDLALTSTPYPAQ